MKPTQVTELFANIRQTFVSFFSILMFVALGVGVYLGISWSGPALQRVADEELVKSTFHNFQVQFPYGLTDSNLEQLKAIEGVSDVEAGYQVFEAFKLNGANRTAKVQSIPDRIDKLSLVEGELPAQEGEIALDATAAEKLGIRVGEEIEFTKDVMGTADVSADASADALGADASSSSGESAAKDPSSGGQSASSSSASASTKDSSSSASASGASSGNAGDSGSAGVQSSGSTSNSKFLKASTFKVTALVSSPEYMCKMDTCYGRAPTSSGVLDAVTWVPFDTFNASAFRDGYPVVNVRCESLNTISAFGREYKDQSSPIQKRIGDMGDILAQTRYDDLHGQAQKKVDEAQTQLDSAKEQVETGTKQVEDGKAELEKQRTEGEAKLAEANEQLKKLQGEYDAGIAQYNEKRQTYAAAMAAIDTLRPQANSFVSEKEQLDAQLANKTITKAQYDQRMEALAARVNAAVNPYRSQIGFHTQVTANNLTEGLNTLKPLLDSYMDIPISYEGQTMSLKEVGAKLDEVKAQLDASYVKLQDGWKQYNDGKAELEQKVADGEAKLAEAEKKIEEAKKEIAEKEPKLEEAKEKLANMKDYDWTVLPRSYNVGVAQVTVFSNILTNLSFSLAGLFVIVGLLVTYSAVSRIVHEQVVLVGTKKALGLRSREITTSFLMYSAIAVITGAIIGVIVGIIAVEGIVGGVLSSLFIMGPYPPYVGMPLCILVVLIELALVLVATWIACRSILSKQAVELLKGKKPPEGKTRFFEKWKMWGRLPLFTQTIVNNCLNDKRRVFSTVVGVAGCTALIVTAVTLNNDVLSSYDRQYKDVYGFDTFVFAESDNKDALGDLEKKVWDQGGSTAKVLKADMTITPPKGGDPSLAYAYVADDLAEFSKLYHVNSVSGGSFDLNGQGVWMAQAYRDHFGAKVGDTVELSIGDGVTHRVPILGFYEFWQTYQEIVIGSKYYESEFGVEYKPNALMVNRGSVSAASLSSALSSIDGFDRVSDDKEIGRVVFEQFSGVSKAVVAIYLLLSVLMAIVVLLNLDVMFVEEKKRELIVLMINGFSVKDAKRYIYNDTIALTVIGIVLGLVVGCITGSLTVASMEWSAASFYKGIDPIAVLAGTAGSAILASIMGVISLRRIPRFELTDINKI